MRKFLGIVFAVTLWSVIAPAANSQSNLAKQKPMTKVSCQDDGSIGALCIELKKKLPDLKNLSPGSTALVVKDGMDRAKIDGLTELNEQLFFIMTALTVHPKFDSIDEIAFAFQKMRTENIPAGQRSNFLLKNIDGKTWNLAGDMGLTALPDYYRSLLGNDELGPFFEAHRKKIEEWKKAHQSKKQK